jgi:agmatine/peptidylarginine deiminase
MTIDMEKAIKKNIRIPAEWEEQSGVIIAFPARSTDWNKYITEAFECFARIAKEITEREKLVVLCRRPKETLRILKNCNRNNIITLQIPYNDTWIRDSGPIAAIENKTPLILDFAFNGWGLKHPFASDAKITIRLHESGILAPNVNYRDLTHTILEGGSIETDGNGTIMTTKQCLISANRNRRLRTQTEIERKLLAELGAQKILWLKHGEIIGDDTDGHIDTLARFCNPDTIAYVQCTDAADPNFETLAQMEEELKAFTATGGQKYRLIPLPLPEPIYFDGARLPATYANFLIINEAVLFPTYGSPKDSIAKQQLQAAFPNRKIIGLDCRVLIRQAGSLHCSTMQLPQGFLT